MTRPVAWFVAHEQQRAKAEGVAHLVPSRLGHDHCLRVGVRIGQDRYPTILAQWPMASVSA